MGDKNRNDLMSRLISKNFRKAKTVLCIADGDGTLSHKLANKGYKVKAIEANPRQARSRKGVDYQKGFFTDDTTIDADIVVGMHPDEATSEIIRWAVKNKKPFVSAHAV